jgi:hypothetical protein
LSHQYKTIIPSEANIKKYNKCEEKAAEEQASKIQEVKPVTGQIRKLKTSPMQQEALPPLMTK